MRLIAIALVVALATAAHAAPVHLETLQHTPVLPSIPTVKRLVFNQAWGSNATFDVTYADSDLGVTVWSAPFALVHPFNLAIHTPNPHGSPSFGLAIGDWFNVGVLAQYNGYPVNRSGTHLSLQGDSSVTFTQHALAAPSFLLTSITMSLSPWTSTTGGWMATQTIELYGEQTPEPATWALVACGLVVAPLPLRRRRTPRL